MLECMVAFNYLEHGAGMVFDPPLGEPGYARARAPNRRPFATRDGHVCMLPYTTRHWRNFFSLMDRPEMLDDPRVTDAATRSRSIDELYSIVTELVAGWTTDDLLKALDAADIPAGAVNQLDALFDDPQLAATNFFRRMEHPTEGRIVVTDIPIDFSASPGEIRRLAPRLGEHSVEILREAGYSDEVVADLLCDGVTVDPTS